MAAPQFLCALGITFSLYSWSYLGVLLGFLWRDWLESQVRALDSGEPIGRSEM